MLAGVLDFFLFDEALLVEFCEAYEIDPEHPTQARMALPVGICRIGREASCNE